MLYCSCCGSGMFPTYSVSRERRYRYYVCWKSQQKLEGYCRTKAVSAPSVETAVVESIRRIGVHPEVLAETALIVRQRLAEILTGLREDLATANARAKNLKSQLSRSSKADALRLAELTEQITEADARAAELRSEIQRREKH